MKLSRRDAIASVSAAAVATAALAVPLAIKAVGVKAALGGDTEEEQMLAVYRQLPAPVRALTLKTIRMQAEIGENSQFMEDWRRAHGRPNGEVPS